MICIFELIKNLTIIFVYIDEILILTNAIIRSKLNPNNNRFCKLSLDFMNYLMFLKKIKINKRNLSDVIILLNLPSIQTSRPISL